ncbi:IS630 family transposase [Natrinema gelatinilyticum]|uniref:IS630 family transposase n=1 Tax=Natrinema gelatinilyticum TaxID=2961571 RepID=UPI0021153318|nr:IS630 family transposase [Natrinema gelatinilyticum]
MKAEGYRIVAIDQHTQKVATEQKPDWFPVNSRPRLPVSGAREKVNMLGAVTDDRERFVALTSNRFNAEIAKHFLRAIQHEFGKKLAIVLDNASYFIAKTLKKQAAADGLLLEFLPAHSPEMNPLENCWRQFREGRANHLFRTLDDVNEYLSMALPALNSPQIYEYLC